MHHHTTTIDTAIEPEEVVLSNGETVTELTKLEIEYCPTCEIVVDWKAEQI